ncbi:hypothetical protein HK096_000696, partial [Nowakowskiella sp. JEL0078]
MFSSLGHLELSLLWSTMNSFCCAHINSSSRSFDKYGQMNKNLRVSLFMQHGMQDLDNACFKYSHFVRPLPQETFENDKIYGIT